MAQSIAKTSTRSQAQRLRLRLSEIHRATPGICVEGFKDREIIQADRKAEVIYQPPPFWGGLSPFELSGIKSWAQGWLDNDQPDQEELIYLASRFFDPDPDVRLARFKAVCLIASQGIADGERIYSPIAHNFWIAQAGLLPFDFDFWRPFDTLMISKSNRVRIADIPGWHLSHGITQEIEIAGELGVPVEYPE